MACGKQISIVAFQRECGDESRCRSRMPAIVMDETFYGAPGTSGKHGRGTGKAGILVVMSKEKETIPCFLKMKVAAVNKENIRQMVCTSVKPGSLV